MYAKINYKCQLKIVHLVQACIFVCYKETEMRSKIWELRFQTWVKNHDTHTQRDVNQEKKKNSFVHNQETGTPLPTPGITEPREIEIEKQKI